MKKVISLLLAALILALSTSVSAFAQTSPAEYSDESYETYTHTEYFDDGSYLVVKTEQTPSQRASTYTKTGRRYVYLYDSSDELDWEYVLVGTYRVTTGVSAVCTNSTYDYTIYDDSWSLTDHGNSYSANVAYGTATFKKKLLFVTIRTQNLDVALTCDRDGNMS